MECFEGEGGFCGNEGIFEKSEIAVVIDWKGVEGKREVEEGGCEMVEGRDGRAGKIVLKFKTLRCEADQEVLNGGKVDEEEEEEEEEEIENKEGIEQEDKDVKDRDEDTDRRKGENENEKKEETEDEDEDEEENEEKDEEKDEEGDEKEEEDEEEDEDGDKDGVGREDGPGHEDAVLRGVVTLTSYSLPQFSPSSPSLLPTS